MINILKLRKMEKEKSEGQEKKKNPEDEVISLDEGKVIVEDEKEKNKKEKSDNKKKKEKKEAEDLKKKKTAERDKRHEEKKKRAAEKEKVKKEEKKKSSAKKKKETERKKEEKKKGKKPEIEEIPLEAIPVIKDEVTEEKEPETQPAENTDVNAEEAFRQKLMEELMAEDFSVESGIEEWPSDIFGGSNNKTEEKSVEKEPEAKEKQIEEKPAAEKPVEKEKPKPKGGDDDLPELTPEEQAEVDRKKEETLRKFLSKTEGKKSEPAAEESVPEVKDSKPAEPVKKESKVEKSTTSISPEGKTVSQDQDEKSKKLENTVQLIGFKLADETYGIDINSIREINRITSITLVPNIPEYVEGVINLRGNVIPIINLRLKTKMPRKEFDSHTRVIIIESESIVVGFIVDEVKEVLRIPESIITPPPAIAVSEAAEYIKAVARTESGLIVLLDTDKLIDRKDFL